MAGTAASAPGLGSSTLSSGPSHHRPEPESIRKALAICGLGQSVNSLEAEAGELTQVLPGRLSKTVSKEQVR